MKWKHGIAAFLLVIGVLCPVPCFGADDAKSGAFSSDRESLLDDYQSMDSMFSLYQPYLENISAYQPIYFLVGTDPEESKFQISLKYRLLNPGKNIVKKYPWSKNFFLAYTQTSFWNLDAASQPFKDTSYKPELFFRSGSIYSGGPDTSRLFVQTGFRHESNGRGAQDSRSTNFAYIQPIYFFFHESTRTDFQIAPAFWAYVGNDDRTNPDLDRYRGYFDLEIKAGRADRLVLESHLRWAAEGGSLQIDATYPLHRLLPIDIDVYLHAQYANGLAESLLNYWDRTRAVRLGISMVR
ncbi:MAG: phospholipase A [Desulfobacterales bacterium]|nr:phospholipase A [Desulfobacterales bacterium]